VKNKNIYILIIFILSLSLNNHNTYSDELKFVAKQNFSNSILLTWQVDKIPYYQEISLYDQEGLFIKKITPLSTITSAIFRNLSVGKSYKIIYKSTNPDKVISKTVFLYTPPINIKNLTYTASEDKIILSWQPKKNNDIIDFRLYVDSNLYKSYSVSASSKGFIINMPNYISTIAIEYNTKNNVGISDKSKIEIEVNKINYINILSKNTDKIDFEIISNGIIEYIIEIYNDDKLIEKFTQKNNIFSISNTNNDYKIIVTPVLSEGKLGSKFNYNYNAKNGEIDSQKNELEKTKEQNDNKNVDSIEEKTDDAKNNLDKKDDPTNSILDITKYKVIRITEINYENNKLNLSWIDPFEQKYVIYSKNSVEKNWKNIGETKLKNINLDITLTKGVNHFKVVGFVDGIKLTESSSRYIFIKS